jgi:ATP-dependent Lhr-like helicase
VALFPGPLAPSDPARRAEFWARLLLERYGVVFRDLLIRETLAPPWRELAPVYCGLEARGEIRGGRFVSGVSGEQFALPDAVERLRALREAPEREQGFVILSAADPLNLLGILNGHPRVASGRNVRLAFESRSGRHVASYDGGEVTFHAELERAEHDWIFTALRLPGPLRQDLTEA